MTPTERRTAIGVALMEAAHALSAIEDVIEERPLVEAIDPARRLRQLAQEIETLVHDGGTE